MSPSPVSGFSHVQLAVSDVAASEAWYSATLGLQRMQASEDGSYVALVHRNSGVVVVLSEAAETQHGRGALDHLAFGAPDGPSLQAWAAELTTAGIEHPGVVDELGKPSLLLSDPDGNQIEIVAPPGSW
jgi:catechol-2,3-dioxygenase